MWNKDWFGSQTTPSLRNYLIFSKNKNKKTGDSCSGGRHSTVSWQIKYWVETLRLVLKWLHCMMISQKSKEGNKSFDPNPERRVKVMDCSTTTLGKWRHPIGWVTQVVVLRKLRGRKLWSGNDEKARPIPRLIIWLTFGHGRSFEAVYLLFGRGGCLLTGNEIVSLSSSRIRIRIRTNKAYKCNLSMTWLTL